MNKQGSVKYLSPTKQQPHKQMSGPQVPVLNTSRDAMRRVWIRRPQGTATSLYVKQDQIVDDLKTMILEKFPMTLAKQFDPSDIVIRLDQGTSTTMFNSPMTRKPIMPTTNPFSSTSPSQYSSPLSPIPISAAKSMLVPPRMTGSDFSSSARSVSPATQAVDVTTPLEADRPIWLILDQYYPLGMSMENAFIVETPAQPYHLHLSHTAAGYAAVPRKSDTITEGKEEDYANYNARRMNSLPAKSGVRSGTPGSAHRRSQSNPPEHGSAVLLMPSNTKGTMSPTSAQSAQIDSRVLPDSPDRMLSPTESTMATYNIKPGSVVSADSPSSRINGTSTMAKVLPSVKVLIVEDNLINLRILSAHLRRHRIHYDVAKNGQEAIDKWRKGGFHLVLMDIQLPVMSGLDASKEIRRLERLNHIGVFSDNDIQALPSKLDGEVLDLDVFKAPIIIVALTASNLKQDKQEALAAGCNDYLTKPVNLDWLLNKITEWGCMQALIDFDGWKSGERMTNISAALPSLTRNGSSRKVITKAKTADSY